jgi:hypothetical protein
LIDLCQISKYFNINVKRIRITSTRKIHVRINDEQLKLLPNLTELSLFYNIVASDNGISKLINLTDLDLRGNRLITDNGIKSLTNLINLNLINNENITDEGIKNLTNLTTLSLNGSNKITDQGINHLTKLQFITLHSPCNIIIDNLEDRFPNLLEITLLYGAGKKNFTNIKFNTDLKKSNISHKYIQI